MDASQRTRGLVLVSFCLSIVASLVVVTARADVSNDASAFKTVPAIELETCAWTPSPWYATVAAVFLDRDNGSFDQPMVIDIISERTLLSTGDLDFDYEPGVRATIGLRRPPCRCCCAWEFSYLGIFDWNTSLPTPTNELSTVPGDLGFVLNGPLNTPEYSSKLHSAEANCIKCFCENCCGSWYRRIDYFAGFRYLSLDEDFTLFGEFPGVAAAVYNIDTDNNLYGAQIGSRMRTYRGNWGWEVLGKAGIFGNDASQRQFIVDELGVNDFLFRAASASGEDVAFVGELGVSLLVQLFASTGLRCGYNLMWIEGVALAPDQLDFSDTLASGTGLQTGGGAFLHGFSVGLEFGW